MPQGREIMLKDLLVSNDDKSYETTVVSDNQTEDYGSLISQYQFHEHDAEVFDSSYRNIMSKYYWSNMYDYLFFRKNNKFDYFGNAYPKEFKRNAKVVKYGCITVITVLSTVIIFFFLSMLITSNPVIKSSVLKAIDNNSSKITYTRVPTITPTVFESVKISAPTVQLQPPTPPKKVIVKIPARN